MMGDKYKNRALSGFLTSKFGIIDTSRPYIRLRGSETGLPLSVAGSSHDYGCRSGERLLDTAIA